MLERMTDEINRISIRIKFVSSLTTFFFLINMFAIHHIGSLKKKKNQGCFGFNMIY
jgi:hypothetical protein